jgi:hypothetical protein
MSNSKKVDAIKVRMYRQGFGDCFLLSFMKDDARIFTMLIDCGIKKNSVDEAKLMKKVVDSLVRELTPASGAKPKLDVLVATHEHWDHISAFFPTNQRDHFKDFEIDQIWLAWTEDPDDAEAVAINSRLRKGTAALGIAASKLEKVESEEAARIEGFYNGQSVTEGRAKFNVQMNDVLGFYGTSLKEVSESGIKYNKNGKISPDTEKALENIMRIGKSNPNNVIKYFSPGTTVEKCLLPAGVNVFVLGPPRSSLINKSDPSSGTNKETYFGMDNGGLTGFVDGLITMGTKDSEHAQHDPSLPFRQENGKSIPNAEKDEFFGKYYYNPKEDYRRIENSWLNVAGQFALQLDNAINNTSLALAIELEESGKILLFPGDAQVGSWLSWHDHKWKVEGSNKNRSAADLLSKTALYKVSHHGSSNATLKAKGLEMMTDPNLVAMIPEKEACYNGILYAPLMTQLEKSCKGRVLVSADVNYPPGKLLDDKPDGLSQTEWVQFKNDLTVETLYIEYTVRV